MMLSVTRWIAWSPTWGWMTRCSWVSVRGKTGLGDIIVGVCYRPPDQEEWEMVHKTLYRQTGAASHSLPLMGDFHH